MFFDKTTNIADTLLNRCAFLILMLIKTIKSVIPMLASASGDHAEIDTTPIIAAFVNNFDFIPKHRRLSYIPLEVN